MKVIGLLLVLGSILSTEATLVEQVATNDQGVCLLIGDAWLVTEGMQASSEGIFVLLNEEWIPLSEAVAYRDYHAMWECSKCHRFNMDGVDVCPYCGKPKNG